jgi:uncharacterized protein
MEPTQLVKNYINHLQKGEFEQLGALFADDIVWHQPGQSELSGTYQGKDSLFALFGKFMTISQGTFKIDNVSAIMANGDTVTATLKFSASKPGSSIAMDGVDVMKVKAGKIVEVHLFSANQAAEDAFWKGEAQ